jgi:hypothetical protein
LEVVVLVEHLGHLVLMVVVLCSTHLLLLVEAVVDLRQIA